MALFIPDGLRPLKGPEIKLNATLAALDDEFVIRTPLLTDPATPQLFLQHPVHGWLALATSSAPLVDLAAQQLFTSPRREALLAQLGGLRRMAGLPTSTVTALPRALLFLSCSAAEVADLARDLDTGGQVILLARDQVLASSGAKLLVSHMKPQTPEDQQLVLERFFPEATIAPALTLGRFPGRDNSPRLTRFFLDAQQEWASKLDLSPEERPLATDFSVRLINGVAGSGKTLVALQRAHILSTLHPEQEILFLIHNRPIVADLRGRFRSAFPDSARRVTIQTLHAFARRQWRRVFGAVPRDYTFGPAAREVVERLIPPLWPMGRLPARAIVEEIDYIYDAFFEDQAAYQAAERTGRGYPLSRKERGQIWEIKERLFTQLTARQPLWSELPYRICRDGDERRLDRHQHIIIDEAQFFSRSAFELVKRSLSPDGQLFLCADPNQGFIGSGLSWKRAGLGVAGRTKKLRRSYRTTRAIMSAATQVLATVSPGDPEEFLTADLEPMEPGSPPLLVLAGSTQDAVDRVANELAAALAADHPLSSFLVVHGKSVTRGMLQEVLQRKLGADRVWCLNQPSQLPPPGDPRNQVRMTSVATATGLEAPVVFLLGMDDLLTRRQSLDALDLSEERQRLERERRARTLFMAMTRAGRQLVLFTRERPAPDIAARFLETSSVPPPP